MKLLIFLKKIFKTALFFISVLVLFLYFISKNIGYKGISQRDLSDLTIYFMSLYILIFLLDIFINRFKK